MAQERILTVPSARPEPESQARNPWLATPFGLASFWLHFDLEQGSLLSQAGLRGETTLNRVDYGWELEFTRTEAGWRATRQELRRCDWLSRPRGEEYPTPAARKAFWAQEDELKRLLLQWVADHPAECYEEYRRTLEAAAYHLEQEVNRDADALAARLEELAELERKIARAQGQVKVETGARARVSPLAV